MGRITEQLRSGAKILEIIDRRRIEEGDPGIGAAIEKAVLDRCLADLEMEPSHVPAGLVREVSATSYLPRTWRWRVC
jgi:hypothetical protein